jgi:hypothetical protein
MWAKVAKARGEHNFLLHIFTSLKRKRRFFKYLFTIHTLFLRLRFRLVRQEIPLRVGFQIRRSLPTKERGPLRQAQGPVEQKVQMEELQWGFPIATPLSLNKPTSINGK